jgi:translation elongation factor EF-Ts
MAASADNKKAVLVELNSETDFVAKKWRFHWIWK